MTLTPEQVPQVIADGTDYRRELSTPAKFGVGDQVRVRNHQPVGHTRLPGYVRGKVGRVAIDQGIFVFPDTMAHRLGEKPQHCYTVHFDARTLWGEKGVAGDTVRVDLFDDYLDLDQAEQNHGA
jgi:nitrile hydratase